MNAVTSYTLYRRTKKANAFCLIAVAAIVLGCSDPSPMTEPRARITPAEVTPGLAATLTADGQFVLPISAVNPPGEINEEQAKAIANRYVREVASSLAGSWEDDHGAAVRANELASCARALYAGNPYATLRGTRVSEITVRTFGPHWVVPMCAGGQLQVVVSFSSQATELTSDLTSAKIPLPWERADIRSFGVPLGVAGSLFTPEGAAQRAFVAAGKRVASVPMLIMNPMPSSPVLVRWRMDLEAPVIVTGTHSSVSRARNAVLVGFGETFKSAGLLDEDPQGEPAALLWTDVVTKEPFTLALTALAPARVELVTRENP